VIQYGKWIVFAVLVLVTIAILPFLAFNKKRRLKLEALILEKFTQTKINELKKQATHARMQAEAGIINAEDAMKIAKETNDAILKQKEDLQKKYEDQGMSVDEISNHINNISI
jgi:hypothetical protein